MSAKVGQALPPANLFDSLAARYDALWTTTAIGRAQRDLAWRHMDPLFQPGDRILDIGCGTGEDAAHFAARGVSVYATDASPAMIQVAAARGGFTAEVRSAEELAQIGGPFDGAISNFGALNCVKDLPGVAGSLAALVRPGGSVAICILGRFCAWETLHYAVRFQFAKAFRRWRGRARLVLLGIRFFARRDEFHATQPAGRKIVAQCVGTGRETGPASAPGRGGRTEAAAPFAACRYAGQVGNLQRVGNPLADVCAGSQPARRIPSCPTKHAAPGITIYYPTIAEIRAAFAPNFQLQRWTGIGLLVPPSYVKLPAALVAVFAACDRRLARLPLLRGLADHRLFLLVRTC